MGGWWGRGEKRGQNWDNYNGTIFLKAKEILKIQIQNIQIMLKLYFLNILNILIKRKLLAILNVNLAIADVML